MTQPPSDDPLPWQRISRRLAYDASPWLRAYVDTMRLPDGRVIDDFHTIEALEHVAIFAVTDDGHVVVERLYRQSVGEVCLEPPAGYVEADEAPELAARRELLEETGYAAREWRHLGSFAVDGNRGMGRLHAYLATGAYLTGEAPKLDEHERLAVVLIPLDTVREMLRRGEFKTLTGTSTTALALLALGES